MPTDTAIDELRKRAAKHMRAWRNADSPQERATATKGAAETLADARTHFYDRDGKADLLGRSYDYRLFVKGALDDAGIPQVARSSLQAAIRYHISPILHERHGEELVERGLTSGSTRDRGRQRRERESAVLHAFNGGAPITDYAEVVQVAHLARAAFNRVRHVDVPSDGSAELITEAFTRAAKAARDAAARATGD